MRDSSVISEVCLPKLGESIHVATIVRWFKKIGEMVKQDEPLLEVTTDKVASEIPAPFSGILTEILVEEGKECDVGAVVCHLSPILSPAVLHTAQEKGLSKENLACMRGSGAGGRVTKRDIMQMDHVRKKIAETMTLSATKIPQASLVHEIDVTNIVTLLKEKKERVFAATGVKLTITAFVAKAMCEALAVYPLLNSRLEGDGILLQKEVHLGIAVDAEGKLYVPVVKNCHNLDLIQVAKEIGKLANKAKMSGLETSDVVQGTITLSNFGMTGVAIGIPLIRYPEAAIIGVGAVVKKVVVVEEEKMAIRSIMHLSLSFDHRIVDGIYSCCFMNKMKEVLEDASCNWSLPLQ